MTGIAGRLERALRNFIETFSLFAAAVLIAHVTNTHSWMTEWGVQLYFGARVAYLALYAAGVFLLRSLVWNVATLGIAMVLLSLVLNHASAVEHAARSGLYCRSLACDLSFSLGHFTSVQSAFVRNWHIASFRCDAEFGRYRGKADIDQAAPIKLGL